MKISLSVSSKICLLLNRINYTRSLHWSLVEIDIDLPIQTLTAELRTSAAEGHRGKSFSVCRGAEEYVQLYARQRTSCFPTVVPRLGCD